MNRDLILVCYYTSSVRACIALIEDFERHVGKFHRRLVVVDNSGRMIDQSMSWGERALVVKVGSNSRWEFSGWLEALSDLPGDKDSGQTITLLNDSLGRNWEVTFASRRILVGMYREADAGRICGWRDNFSIWQPPRFSRRTNSRVVLLPRNSAIAFIESLRRAIELCDRTTQLFSGDEQRALQRWFRSQAGRWGPDQLEFLSRRIFIEHHLFDSIPTDKLVLLPRTYLGSLLYAAARRLFQERR